MIRLRKPFIYETPAKREGAPHMTLLQEFQPIIDHPEVAQLVFDQCTRGARAAKATLLLLFMVDVSAVAQHLMPSRCYHLPRWWTVPWSGHSYWAPHPSISGRQWAIPSEEWHPGLRCDRQPPGDFISRSMAAYPTGLNETLATWLVNAGAARPTSAAPTLVKAGAWGNALVPATSFEQPADSTDIAADMLKPTVHKRPRLAAPCAASRPTWAGLGGLRRTAKSVQHMHADARLVGARLRHRIGEWLVSEPDTLAAVLETVSGQHTGTPPTEVCPRAVARARDLMADVLDPVSVERSPISEIYADLLSAWRKAARDPDDLPEHWAAHGAPGGVTMDIEDRGVFECYDAQQDERAVDPESLETEPDFVNYAGVEEDDLVAEELERLVQASWLLCFDNVEAAAVYLEAQPVLSRIGVITKERLGKISRRIVTDAKRSKVSAASRKFQRVILPRVTDIVVDALEMLAATSELPIDWFEFFIADFKDAFFHIPLHRREQQFFTFSFRGKVYVLLRTAQGSRGAPLTWARTAALLARLTQAMFPADIVRTNVYVDDPLMAIRGNAQRRNLVVATILLVWSALGFSLSLRKARRAPAITWTSAHFNVYEAAGERYVSAQTKQELVEDARALTLELMGANVVPKKKLRKLAGKASHIASLIFALRPFAAELWAALCTAEASWAPNGCVWRAQIHHTLVWLAAFFTEVGTTALVRHFSVSAMFNKSQAIELVLDASPWGLGAALIVDGAPLEYFASQLTAEDESVLTFTIGSCEAQQTVEALAVLVAHKTWAERLRTRRCTITVKSDSMSALHMVSNMTSRGHGCRAIARELALVFTSMCHRPDIVAHIPGISNKVADELSRKFEPGHVFTLPPFLMQASERWVPVRDRAYYATLASEPGQAIEDAARYASG